MARTIVRGRLADLNAAAEWARALCHLVYGPDLGEARYRRMPAIKILSLWARA